MLPLSKKNRESLKAAYLSERGYLKKIQNENHPLWGSEVKKHMSRHPWYLGVGTLWLAIDSKSRVGAFYHGSSGGPPQYILQGLHHGSPAILDHLEFEILCMPKVSEADTRILHAHANFNLFNDLARRGFFVYNGVLEENSEIGDVHYYEPVAIPTNPIVDTALNGNVRTIANSFRRPELTFGYEARLYPKDLYLFTPPSSPRPTQPPPLRRARR